ncbi:MAG: NAD(P)/FAD-dependent oxidoreductase [Clostridiales bacterium]|jgi:dihydrolipoamide dehydrogenase|nr:NAD(P)/FAD-dependent oxidoreductase [Clostridiales bacterium]
MIEKFDIAVIGGGPGGYTAALIAAKGGKSVVIFEEKLLGGTCLNTGCIPTKALLNMAKNYSRVKESDGYIVYSELSFDYKAADIKKNAAVDKIRENLTRWLAQNKIKIVNAKAALTGGKGIEADGNGYEAENIIIAAGAKPASYGIYGIELAYSVEKFTKELVFDKDVVIIGGGVAGLETAAFYSMIGSRVSMIMMEDRPLPSYDKDISQTLTMQLKKKGITLYTGSVVKSIVKQDEKFSVSFVPSGTNEAVAVVGGLVIDASGRRPNIDIEGLDKAEIKYDSKGIYTDGAFKSSAVGIYAVGDVVRGNIQLAHKAAFDAERVMEDILSGHSCNKGAPVVPACVYTSPEISCAGMTTADCTDSGTEYLTSKVMMGANGKAVSCDAASGFVKVIFAKIDDETKALAGVPYLPEKRERYRLVGVHIIAENSSEMIGGLASMIAGGALKGDIMRAPFPHPTLSEAFREAVSAIAAD